MSKHNVKHFFQFERVKITEFSISEDALITQVKLEPNLNYLPVCSGCKKKFVAFILMRLDPFKICL